MPPKLDNKLPPKPVRQRLPQYLWYVREQRSRANKYVTSQEIAYALGITSSTVRQDFSSLNITNGARQGYAVEELDRAISNLVHLSKEKPLVVVGAGNLGRALALHGNLAKYGFSVRAIVDNDPAVVGSEVGGLVVRSIDELPSVVREHNINIGVIAVPAESAQRVADLLILSGVDGLLNLALGRVVAPERVSLVHNRIVSSLLQLSHVMPVD